MRKLILFLCVINYFNLLSQEPVLVRQDYLGSGKYSKGTFRNLKAVGNTLFFVTDDGINGSELFKSDGTEGGTVLVKDIYPGAGKSKSSNPEVLINFNNQLFFYAYTGGSDGEGLWKSDGTEAGTVKVKALREGSGNPLYASNLVIGNTMYFEGESLNNQYGLWKTDGTEAGTIMVKAFNRDTNAANNLSNFIEYKNKMYFSAFDSAKGSELWVSDGTESGTVLLKDIMPGDNTSHSGIGGMTIVGEELLFAANDGTSGSELWKTDGSASGTTMIKDIMPGANSSNIGDLENVNGVLFFRADDSSANGSELWKSDGTASGTVMIKDIRPGNIRFSTDSKPTDLRAIGNLVYFIANDGEHGTELWKSDGTEAGTVMIKDIETARYQGGASSNSLVVFNNQIIFKGTDANGQEHWVSYGTEAGTKILKDTNGDNTIYAKYFDTNLYVGGGTITDNGVFFFLSYDGVNGTEPGLWKFDQSALSVEKESLNHIKKVRVFPNPVSSILNLKADNQQIQSLRIYNLFGTEVMNVSNKNKIKNINISNFSTGIYMLQLKTDSGFFTKKFIKK